MSDTPKIIRLIDESNSSLHWTPLDALKEAVREYETGQRTDPKVFIIFLDDLDGFRLTTKLAGATSAQAITMCEVAKRERMDTL